MNGAIKKAIKEGYIKSDCSGNKIEESAYVWI